MKCRVIDANIVLRFILADHAQQSPRCRKLFERVVNDQEQIRLPEAALSDVVWTLGSFYKMPKTQIRQFVLDVLALDGVRMARKPVVRDALDLFAVKNIDFTDALVISEMQHDGETEVYSFDRDFDKMAEIKRLEP